MRRRMIAALAVGVLLALAGCTSAGDPPPESDSGRTSTSASSGSGSDGGDPEPVEPTGKGTPPADPDDPDEQALLDLVRAEGTVSVIVAAKLDGEAERGSDEHQRLVDDARDALEAELDPDHAEVTTRFDLYPRLTLTVDETALRDLFASPRVANIWENRSIPLEPAG